MNTASLQILRAQVHHLEALVPLFDSYRQFYGQRSDLAIARSFLSDRLRLGDSVIFLASSGAKFTGFTQLYPSFSSVSTKRLWILNDLFVVPEFRRCGIARRLMNAAREHAKVTVAKGLTLSTQVENLNAQKLYESSGYVRDKAFFTYHLVF